MTLWEEQKREEILYHSEMIVVVVFGVINLAKALSVRIMKKLRICGECHTFVKFVYKVSDGNCDFPNS